MFKEIEAHYYRVEMPKVRQKIAKLKQEAGEWGKCRRLIYLYDRLNKFDLELIERESQYQRSFEQDSPYIERAFIALPISEIEKEIEKLERDIDFLMRSSQQSNNGITDEMIQRAREYPIESFVTVKRSMALCPFHDDKNPSMSIRNNHFYCFACNAHGDAIEFVMKRDGLSFVAAIRTLAS